MYTKKELDLIMDIFDTQNCVQIVEITKRFFTSRNEIIDLAEKMASRGHCRIIRQALPKYNKLELLPAFDKAHPEAIFRRALSEKNDLGTVFSDKRKEREGHCAPESEKFVDEMLYSGEVPKRDFRMSPMEQIMKLMAEDKLPKPVTDETHFQGHHIDSYQPSERAMIRRKIAERLGKAPQNAEAIKSLEAELNYNCVEALSCPSDQINIHTAAISGLRKRFADLGGLDEFLYIHSHYSDGIFRRTNEMHCY